MRAARNIRLHLDFVFPTALCLSSVLAFTSFALRIHAQGTPVILKQPQSIYTFWYCPTRFVVEATGTPPLFYQWHRLGSQDPIPGATNAVLELYPTISDSGDYYAVVFNALGGVTNSSASLTVSLDFVPPRLASVSGGLDLQSVTVRFYVGNCASPSNVLRSDRSANYWNYQLNGGLTVTGAELDCTGTNVILTTSRQNEGTLYTLTVDDIEDLTGNVLTDGQTTFTSAVRPSLEPQTIRCGRSEGRVLLEWGAGGVLQVASNPSGPWDDVLGVVGAYWINTPSYYCSNGPQAARQFYRVQWPAPPQ